MPATAAMAMRRIAEGIAARVGTRDREESESRRRVEHMRRIATDVTQFFSPSQYLRNEFIRFGVPVDRIAHAPLGFDHVPFQVQAAVRRPVDTRGPLRLGFVGTLMVSKAPHLLVEAARGFETGAVRVDLFGPQADYHGDDSYRQRLAPLLSAPGVRHHGPVPHSSIPAALASLDILVVPSVWPENSPLVIHEAFLAGVPVIASRIGGIPELVEHGRNGLLFEPGNATALHKEIARLLDDPGLLNRLRAGIGSVRTIEDDVASLRRLYLKRDT
jgi:glycosyltransferase involved in cell wall biosynthesis